MKKILILVFLLAAAVSHAQKEGKVIYESVTQMRRPQGMDPQMAARIPPSRTDHFELLFGADQSLWRTLPKAEGEGETFGGGGGAMFRMINTNEEIYHHFGTARRLEKRELFDKTYLIEDTISKLSWKLSGETKTILNYKVQKAVAQRYGSRMQMTMENGEMKRQQVGDTSTLVAWFTTDFPVQAGPQDLQGQLPGLVLELDINNGRTVYKAVEVSPKVALSSIKAPKGGKRIDREQFAKEREKMMAELQRNMPRGRSVQIVTN